MDKDRVARCLIVKYLKECMNRDKAAADELSVAIECLTNVWGIDDSQLAVPGVNSLIDIIPDPKYDTERAVQLKVEGNDALKAGNLDLAMAKYTEAISVDPTQATFYCNRAAVYSKKGEHTKAIEDCEKAISLDPKYATAYSRLGFAYFQLKRVDEARKAYERGVRACPDNQSLKDNLKSLGPETPSAGAGAGAAPGGDFLSGMLGAFAQNPMFGQIAQKLQSPEVQAMLQEPGMAELVQQVQQNPAMLFQNLGDPRIQRLMGALMPGFGGMGA